MCWWLQSSLDAWFEIAWVRKYPRGSMWTLHRYQSAHVLQVIRCLCCLSWWATSSQTHECLGWSAQPVSCLWILRMLVYDGFICSYFFKKQLKTAIQRTMMPMKSMTLSLRVCTGSIISSHFGKNPSLTSVGEIELLYFVCLLSPIFVTFRHVLCTFRDISSLFGTFWSFFGKPEPCRWNRFAYGGAFESPNFDKFRQISTHFDTFRASGISTKAHFVLFRYRRISAAVNFGTFRQQNFSCKLGGFEFRLQNFGKMKFRQIYFCTWCFSVHIIFGAYNFRFLQFSAPTIFDTYQFSVRTFFGTVSCQIYRMHIFIYIDYISIFYS